MINGLDLWDGFYQGCSGRYIDFQKCYKNYLAPKGLEEKAREAFKKIKYFNGSKPMSSKDLKERLFRKSYGSDGSERNVLRVFFNDYLSQIVEKKKLNISLPKEYLVIKPDVENKSKYSYEDFYVISEKLDLKNFMENIEYINGLSEERKKEVATDICNFIWYTGFEDAHFNNLMFTKDGKNLTCIDNEPLRLMLLKGINRDGPINQGLVSYFLGSIISGFEELKRRRIEDLQTLNKLFIVKEKECSEEGKKWVEEKKKISYSTSFHKLFKNNTRFFNDKEIGRTLIFEKDFLKSFGKDIFIKTVNRYLKYAYLRVALQIFTIVLSILCPLIPLIVLTSSLAYAALYNIGYYFKNSLVTKKLVIQTT